MDQQQLKYFRFEKKEEEYVIAREYKKAAGMKTTIDQLYPDIWQQIFEYFNAIELFVSLVHVTTAADEVLFNRNYHFRLRELVVDVSVQTLPEKLALSQVVSLELHQESCLDIIAKCVTLRSLKLIGQPEWIIHLLEKVSHIDIKLEQLTLIVPGVGSLHDLLASIVPFVSLHRLEIYGNQVEEKIKAGAFLAQTEIEQFILHSCSSISWNELSYMLPGLSNIRFLDMTLFHHNKNSFSWFAFPNLLYIHLRLLEVSFEWIIQLVTTMPSLVKLKLNGLVDGEGFVFNHKWLNLFESCTTLVTVNVNVSLEQAANFFCMDMVQADLRKINLNLQCSGDDCDYYFSERNQQRWWKLSGTITRQYGYV